MATDRERTRCRERLHELAASTLDTDSLRHEAVALLRRAIGFDRWCWPLADPETLIPLSGLAVHDYGPWVPRALELEFSGGDFAAMAEVARGASPSAALSGATGGDLARSPRWDEVFRHVGIGDEAVVACRDGGGCWGWLKAYRDRSERAFSEEDVRVLADVASTLGGALRRGLGRDGRAGASLPRAAGVFVLDEHLRLLAATAAAREWIASLPAAAAYAAFGMLPAMIYPAATLVRKHRDLGGVGVLERTVEGRWVMIDAAVLDSDGAYGTIAVTFRDATGPETFHRLARVYALTQRERQVVAGVVAGDDTTAIARRLVISRHTVQDHLKAVFAKVGVHSRRELSARFSVPALAASSGFADA